MAPLPQTIDQNAFRGRNDDGNETTATWIAAKNVNWTQTLDVQFRVRFGLIESGGGDHELGFKVQFNHKGLGWFDVTTTSGAARMAASTGLTEGSNCTAQLALGGTFQTTNAGQEDGDGTVPDTAETKAGKTIEHEYSVVIRSAVVAATEVVQFRVVESDGTALQTYTNTPSVTAASATPVYEQASYRFRNLQGSEAGASYKAAVNTDVVLSPQEPFALRYLLKCTVAGETTSFSFEYNLNGAGWVSISNASDIVRFQGDGANGAHGDDTTQQVGVGAFIVDNNGVKASSVTNPTLVTAAGQEWETEGSFVTLNVGGADSVQVRCVSGGATPLDTYTNTPTITFSSPSGSKKKLGVGS